MLDKLEALVRQGSRASNDAVLDLVVDLLSARGDVLQPSAREACVELFALILGRGSIEARRAASRRLADLPGAPRPALLALAHQSIEVAAPVLERSRTLSTADLMGVLTLASPAHVRAVSRREALTETLTDQIVRRGDRAAVMQALANPRALFSTSSLAGLADAAVADSPLRATLVLRGDLPAPAVETLWPALDGEGRARLIASGWRYSPEAIDEAVAEAMTGPHGPVRDLAWPDPAALPGLVEGGRLIEAACLIAATHGLSPGLVVNLLHGAYDRGFAVLARHAGLDDSAVLGTACARSRLSWIRAGDARRVLQRVAGTGAREARDAMTALEALWAGASQMPSRAGLHEAA